MTQTLETKPQTIITPQILAKYLNLYTGNIGTSEWEAHIKKLYLLQSKKIPDRTQATEKWRKTISCAILLPETDKSVLTSPPENLLYWCSSYRQFGEKDWYKLFIETVEKDAKIEIVRKHCQSLGVIFPLEYSPLTRQALNWLVDKAKYYHPEEIKDIIPRMEKLVYAYGGSVICGVFDKAGNSIDKKILKWNTSYFFERFIFTIYSPEQVVKIKKAELAKTHQKLVKQIAVKEQK